MLNNETNSLDFVTDIRRAVYCILNKNIPTARSFLAKADFLVEHELKLGNVDKKLRFNFYNYWKNLYQQKKIPSDRKDQIKFADLLLTLSSKVFLRSIYAKH